MVDLSCISWVGSVLLCSTSHTPMVRDWKISHSNEDASSICIPFMETLGCTKITWLYLTESYDARHDFYYSERNLHLL